MKNRTTMIPNLITPIIIVIIIFIIAKLAKSNYNLQNMKQYQTATTIIDKNIKPAGTTPMYRSIGGQIRAIPVTNQEEPTIIVKIKGKQASGIIEKEFFNNMKVGDTVNIEYLVPKYWGKPIIITIKKGAE